MNPSQNLVIAAAAGYSETQIRPFIASLAHFSPKTTIELLISARDSAFEEAVRAWCPNCTFHLLPPAPLRDLGMKRKWARSILKRLTRCPGLSCLGKRLLKVNYMRYSAAYDLLAGRKLNGAKVLLSDSRDVVFQSDPFSGEWPPLWTCEEDKCIAECHLNSLWIRRVVGDAAYAEARQHRIVCSGIIGGQAEHVIRYLQLFGNTAETAAPRIVFQNGDQGIHNYLARLRPELGFTILPNGNIAANLQYMHQKNLSIRKDQVYLRNNATAPAILHQYDRHPHLAELVQNKWASARPPVRS